MIIGIGIDFVEVARMKRETTLVGHRFIYHIFTEGEVEYCASKRYPERHYAARFAAKEAFFKALGTGVLNQSEWLQVEVMHGERNHPELKFSGGLAERVASLGVKSAFVSITHTADHAAAVVVLEG